MEALKRLKDVFQKEKRVRILAIIGALGILLLCLSEFLPKAKKAEAKTEPASSAAQFQKETEQRLRETLSKVQGAGRVEVMVTLASSDERVYAADEKSDVKTGRDSTQQSRDAQYVMIDGQNGDEGMLVKTNTPQVLGVIVVCDGGDSPSVKNQITNALCGALGIGANRVSVLKMKSAEE